MGEDIAKGNVKLNYNVCEKKNATVGQGDTGLVAEEEEE